MIGRLATFVAGLVYTLLYTNKWPPYSNALYRLGSKQFYIGLGAICFVVKWARSVECDALSVALFSSLLPLQSLIRLCCLMEDLVMNDYGSAQVFMAGTVRGTSELSSQSCCSRSAADGSGTDGSIPTLLTQAAIPTLLTPSSKLPSYLETSEEDATKVAKMPIRQWKGHQGTSAVTRVVAMTPADLRMPIWQPLTLELEYRKRAPGCFGVELGGYVYWEYNRLPNVHLGSKWVHVDSPEVTRIIESLSPSDRAKATRENVVECMNQEMRLLEHLADDVITKHICDTATRLGMKRQNFLSIDKAIHIGKHLI